MKISSSKIHFKLRKSPLLAWGVIFFLLSQYTANSQLSVHTAQNLSFGAFSPGNSGGTVIIASNGTRSVSGNIIPLNMGYQYFSAIFEVAAPAGTIINIMKGPNVQLTGSNGGSMTLSIGNSDPASPFISSVNPTNIKVGASLIVGSIASNPPGTYTGTFSITFIQE